MTTQTAVQAIAVFPPRQISDPERHHVYIVSSRGFMEQFPNLAQQVWFYLGMEIQSDGYEGQNVVVHVEEQTGEEQPFHVEAALSRTEEDCTALGAYALEQFRSNLEDWTMDCLARLAGVSE